MLLETDRLSLAVPSVDHFEGYRGLWGDEPPEFEGVPHFPALRQEEVLTRLLLRRRGLHQLDDTSGVCQRPHEWCHRH